MEVAHYLLVPRCNDSTDLAQERFSQSIATRPDDTGRKRRWFPPGSKFFRKPGERKKRAIIASVIIASIEWGDRSTLSVWMNSLFLSLYGALLI